jgi:hypothetical protein
MLASPRAGAIAALPGSPELDIFGIGGMIFVQGCTSRHT